MEQASQGICFRVQRADIFSSPQSTSPSTTSWSEALKRNNCATLLGFLVRRQEWHRTNGTLAACLSGVAQESRKRKEDKTSMCTRDSHGPCSTARETDTHAREHTGVQVKSRRLSWKFIREWLSHEPQAAAENGQLVCLSDANDRGSGDDGSEKPHSRLIVLVVKSSLFNSS
jgi:hypothetical protein